MTPPLQVTHAGRRYGATDLAAGVKLSTQLTLATGENATVGPTVRYCQAQECGRPIRGLLASCDNPVCVAVTATAEERAYRWADE